MLGLDEHYRHEHRIIAAGAKFLTEYGLGNPKPMSRIKDQDVWVAGDDLGNVACLELLAYSCYWSRRDLSTPSPLMLGASSSVFTSATLAATAPIGDHVTFQQVEHHLSNCGSAAAPLKPFKLAELWILHPK